MQINEETKLIARFHKKVSPRSLNIYNPVFQELGINAVYLLFYNEDPTPLMDGFRKLNITGSIAAGFESNPILPTLLDELDEVAKFVGKVGYVYRKNNKVVGGLQGGAGILRTIKLASSLEGKTISLVGAGNIAKGLLYEIKKEGILCEVIIYNRTLEKALDLQKNFAFVKGVRTLEELSSATGNVLVNVSDIGGEVEDNFFTEKIINSHGSVVDVTFERENTNLITTARKLSKNIATGWDMFANQGIVCLEQILGQKIPFEIMRKHVEIGLSEKIV